jgi:hypothetical protein
MTDSSTRNKHTGRPGNPGSFDAKEFTDSDVSLTMERSWGSTGITEGSRTPWGASQRVEEIAPGITFAPTEGHGGIKLSPERNREIHPALRNRNGWYEEDCDAHIVAMRFNEHFNESAESASDGVRRWYPDAWEAATGLKIQPGESRVRDEANFVKSHEDDLVGHSSRGADDGTDRLIVPVLQADGETAEFYMSKDEVKAQRDNPERGQEHRIIVDPANHEKLPPKPKPVLTPAPKFRLHEIGTPKTTAATAKLVKDLSQRFRSADGRVRSLADELAEGITGKTAYIDGSGKRTYHLTQKAHVEDSTITVYPVSKSTFDLVGAPDSRTPHDIAYQDYSMARDKLEKMSGWDDRKKARDRVAELKAALEATPE